MELFHLLMGRLLKCRRKFLSSQYHQLAIATFHFFLCYCVVTDLVHTESINAFNDNVAFQMRWAGSLWQAASTEKENALVMTTEDQEKYVCIIPGAEDMNEMGSDDYNGPTALNVLRPLFSKVSCHYRLEQYWTYELCHGHHLRQYHEESTLRGMHVQEFILGRFDADEISKSLSNEQKVVPTKRLGDKDKPYLELLMGDGTLCDLNGEPRVTRVLYFCDEGAGNDLHSLKETSSCEYEAIVLTPLLCLHPLYREKDKPINKIQCHALEHSPRVPSKMLQLEREEKEFEIAAEEDDDVEEEMMISPLPPPPPPAPKVQKKTVPQVPHDPKLVADFLSGMHCLQGGSGWWKYEFCFGKKVKQYHDEHKKARITILLGRWNQDAHIAWIRSNPQKRPTSKQVSHFYGNGAACDLSGEPRQVEVKLRCKASSRQTNAVSMFLLEPRTCKYTLTVETPIVCPILESADEYGLFQQHLL